MNELKQFEVHYIDCNGEVRFRYVYAFYADHAKLLWEDDAADGEEFISAAEVGDD